ncbi:MAG: zf-HC2 domain-containing protein [Armatimonadetes bacterium]|nr:zf-HC2 domain-containing protein [Armatimonadota bacterium]
MPEMDCQDVIKRMGSYLDRELDEREVAAVRAHLGHCAWCEGAFRWEGSILRLVKESAHAEAPKGLLGKLMQNCDQE